MRKRASRRSRNHGRRHRIPGNASPVKKKTPPNRVTLSEKGD
jgi:hypothetical protein